MAQTATHEDKTVSGAGAAGDTLTARWLQLQPVSIALFFLFYELHQVAPALLQTRI
jgi:hypothetical protein